MSYSFAGTSVLKGELKVRFANSDARAKQLVKLGDVEVNIVALPHTKIMRTQRNQVHHQT